MVPHPNRRAVLTSIVLVILVAIGAAAAHGQVAVGDTVRFYSNRHRVTGVLAGLDSGSLVIRNDAGDARYPRATVGEVEVLRGRHRAGLSSVAKGAVIGFTAGVGFGVYADRTSPINDMPNFGKVIGAVLGTATGTLVGGILAFRQVGSWQPGYVAPSLQADAPSVVETCVVFSGDVAPRRRGERSLDTTPCSAAQSR